MAQVLITRKNMLLQYTGSVALPINTASWKGKALEVWQPSDTGQSMIAWVADGAILTTLQPMQAYYFVFKDTSGWAMDDMVDLGITAGTTPPAGNTTPAAPSVSFNSDTRVLTASHALGASELEYNRNNGAYQAYAALSIDDNAHDAAEWLFRVKAATGRNASSPTPSPSIAAKTTTPPPGPGVYGNPISFFRAGQMTQLIYPGGVAQVDSIGNQAATGTTATPNKGPVSYSATGGPNNKPYLTLNGNRLNFSVTHPGGNEAVLAVLRIKGAADNGYMLHHYQGGYWQLGQNDSSATVQGGSLLPFTAGSVTESSGSAGDNIQYVWGVLLLYINDQGRPTVRWNGQQVAQSTATPATLTAGTAVTHINGYPPFDANDDSGWTGTMDLSACGYYANESESTLLSYEQQLLAEYFPGLV